MLNGLEPSANPSPKDAGIWETWIPVEPRYENSLYFEIVKYFAIQVSSQNVDVNMRPAAWLKVLSILWISFYNL